MLILFKIIFFQMQLLYQFSSNSKGHHNAIMENNTVSNILFWGETLEKSGIFNGLLGHYGVGKKKKKNTYHDWKFSHFFQEQIVVRHFHGRNEKDNKGAFTNTFKSVPVVVRRKNRYRLSRKIALKRVCVILKQAQNGLWELFWMRRYGI